MRALDLFCGDGGATKGLQMAGFHVTGIDNRPHPRYCGNAFIQTDALAWPLVSHNYDFIWASPPCQKWSALARLRPGTEYPDLISETRARLIDSGAAWCIENVEGAPLSKFIAEAWLGSL